GGVRADGEDGRVPIRDRQGGEVLRGLRVGSGGRRNRPLEGCDPEDCLRRELIDESIGVLFQHPSGLCQSGEIAPPLKDRGSKGNEPIVVRRELARAPHVVERLIESAKRELELCAHAPRQPPFWIQLDRSSTARERRLDL